MPRCQRGTGGGEGEREGEGVENEGDSSDEILLETTKLTQELVLS